MIQLYPSAFCYHFECNALTLFPHCARVCLISSPHSALYVILLPLSDHLSPFTHLSVCQHLLIFLSPLIHSVNLSLSGFS